MEQKILILGGTGMAGHIVHEYLLETGKYDLYNTVFRVALNDRSIICDIRKQHVLQQVIDSVKPTVIINCIGALINDSRANPENAILLNSFLPHFLVKQARSQNARLIHISTDCVFSGKKGYYTEDDFRDADDVYGRSKALGEINNEFDVNIRTSIIGPELKENGEGLFHWFTRQKGTVKGYGKAFWGGVTTLELAKAIELIIDTNLVGLLQLSNGTPISKFELLKLFIKYFKTEVSTVEPFESYVVDKTLAPSARFDFEVPDYDTMIHDMHIWMAKHRGLYTNYHL